MEGLVVSEKTISFWDRFYNRFKLATQYRYLDHDVIKIKAKEKPKDIDFDLSDWVFIMFKKKQKHKKYNPNRLYQGFAMD